MNNTNTNQSVKKSVGFDEDADVYDGGVVVLRGVKKHVGFYKKLVNTISSHDVLSQLVAPTKIHTEIPSKLKKYKLILIQTKIAPLIYPHEWPTVIFKQTAQLQLQLFKNLIPLGLTLKDSHPWNWAPINSQPKLFDFTSITSHKINNQQKFWSLLRINNWQKTLYSIEKANFYKNYTSMYRPFFLYPLLLMQQRQETKARQLLWDRALNASDKTITLYEVYPNITFTKIAHIFYEHFKSLILALPFGIQLFIYLTQLQIKNCDVESQNSGYVTYYKNKAEDYDLDNSSQWKSKQKNIAKILKKYKPTSVLDVGANTGWFSELASKYANKVIGTDVDEACVNYLFKTQKDNQKITSLVLDVLDLKEDKLANKSGDKKRVLYLGTNKRLKSDMVLALAIMHHLVIGQEKSFTQVFEIFSKLTKKVLVVEYVDLSDPVMKDTKTYFKNKKKFSAKNYNIEVVEKAGLKYFSKCKIMKSNPSTRKIFVFEK